MMDREKVINGLEQFIADFKPFCGNKADWQRVYDALALLKAQEPRLVTEADFENADEYGYLPVWVEDKDDSEIICDCITKTAITDPDEDYHYRFWTSRPTDEQREAVKWE